MKLKYENLRKFETIEEAKKFYEDILEYEDAEFCKVNGELILMCGTVNAYDDNIENLIRDMMLVVLKELGFILPDDHWFGFDWVKPIAEEFMDSIQEMGGYEVEYLYDEF